MHACMSVRMGARVFASACLSLFLLLSQSLSPSLPAPVCFCLCLSMPVCLSVCLSDWLAVHPSVSARVLTACAWLALCTRCCCAVDVGSGGGDALVAALSVLGIVSLLLRAGAHTVVAVAIALLVSVY